MRKALAVLIVSLLTVAAAPMAPASAAAFGVTAAASKTQLTLGSSFTLIGAVSPSAGGKTVNIQRRYAGGSWVTFAHRTLSSTSKYSATITPIKGGPTDYRVVKPASATRSVGISAIRRVNVFRWRYLYDLPVAAEEPGFRGSYTINGNTFDKSFMPPSGYSIRWNYDSLRCTKFETFVGIADDAPSGTGGGADEYYFEDTTLASFQWVTQYDLTRGQDPRYLQHTFGSYDHGLLLNNDPVYSNYYLVFANPRVYCNS